MADIIHLQPPASMPAAAQPRRAILSLEDPICRLKHLLGVASECAERLMTNIITDIRQQMKDEPAEAIRAEIDRYEQVLWAVLEANEAARNLRDSYYRVAHGDSTE